MQHKSLIDKIFFGIFFISLLIPTMHITKDKIARTENRRLARYMPLYDTEYNVFNLNYGNDLENYLKDRFWGRMSLINIERSINYFLAVRYIKIGRMAIDKEKKFMYETLYMKLPGEQEQYEIISNLKIFNEYCRQHNIKFYLEIVPCKESVYTPEFIINNKISEINKRLARVNDESGVKFISSLDETIAARDKSPYLLYHKTDHHATIDGTFISYKVLMQEIKKDFSEVEIVDFSDFNQYEDKRVKAERSRKFSSGYTCKQIGIFRELCNDFLNVNYRYVEHKNVADLQKNETLNGRILKYDFYYPQGSDLKVLVFGDSYTANLMEFLPYSFRNTSLIRLNGPYGIEAGEQFKILKYYKNEIQKFQPDIVIVYIMYGTVPQLKHIAEEQ